MSDLGQLSGIHILLVRAPARRFGGRLRHLAKGDRIAVAAAVTPRFPAPAARRNLAHEYPPELLPDEAVHGKVDGRVEGDERVAGYVGVPQRTEVQPDGDARREHAGRERNPDADVRQLAHDEHRHNGDQHQREVLAARAARLRLLLHQQAPATTPDGPQRPDQLTVEHDQRDERADGAEHEVADGLVDEEVFAVLA